jgi:arylsulfatase A-like enzyme
MANETKTSGFYSERTSSQGPASPHDRGILSSRSLLRIAMWFGLLGGLSEAGVLAAKGWVFHRLVHLNPDIGWLAPLTQACWLSLAAALVILAARRWPRIASLRVASAVFAFLSCFSVLLLYVPLHRGAAVLIAAGLATQISRGIASHPAAFTMVVRRTTALLLAVVLGIALVLRGRPVLVEHLAIARLPATPPGAPNVLLLVLDTVRAQNLSLYGYGRDTTPRLAEFARRGVRFDHALAPSPWTLPSHASMFTGRPAHELSADWLTPLDGAHPTLAEALQARGYLTGAFVANTFFAARDSGLARGFLHYEDHRISFTQVLLSSALGRFLTSGRWLRRYLPNRAVPARKSAAEINASFLRWLSERQTGPFLAFLNYYDAHAPYRPPAPFDQRFGPRRPYPWLLDDGATLQFLRAEQVTEPGIESMVDAYDGAIGYLDDQLGKLFDELGRRELLENTLVIVTSDHGEQFGTNGLFGHGNSLYRPLLHVPLLIVFPTQVPRGRIVAEPVALRDLPATVMDLTRSGPEPPFPGDSLARFWRGGDVASEPVLSTVSRAAWWPKWLPVSKANLASLVGRGYHYIEAGAGREELYDFDNDPFDEHDLATSDGDRDGLPWFRATLKKMLDGVR